jgi:hypothetical protein
MKIKNVEQLRNYMLENLEKMSANKIDVDEMGIIAKAAEGIMASAKIQLTYAAMLGDAPHIPFLHECHDARFNAKALDAPKPKLIQNKK